MTRPLLLDLFCGAGGAAKGYHDAGFDVIGVDINPQPRYPYRFVQRDAMDVLDVYADMGVGLRISAIHASPPCQDHSTLSALSGEHGTGWMLDAARDFLDAIDLPYVIENVPGAPMRADYRLCGCQFDLPGLRRERWFETSWHGFDLKPPCHHTDDTVTVAGHPGGSSARDGSRGYGNKAAWERAMGIDWMTAKELAQAIPPAYTEWVGRRLMEQLTGAAA